MKKKKIIFLPAGIGLAHVGRTSFLAKELEKRGFEVKFGIGKHSSLVLKKEGLPFEILPEITFQDYEEKFRKLKLRFYSRKMIAQFVKAEIDFFKKEKPGVVVFDVRPTVKISAQALKTPLVSLVNTEATKYYDFSKIKIFFPSYWGRFLPLKIKDFFENGKGEKILKKTAPLILKTAPLLELTKFNLERVKYGLKPLTSFFDFLEGDLTLLLDIPQVRPVKPLPKNVKIVGPIFWKGTGQVPSWAEDLKKEPIIYVTAGGTGDKEIFQKIINYLKHTSYQVVATVGNSFSPSEIELPKRDDFFLDQFVPGEWIMKKASLVIFPGGSSTAYQVLTAGCPQIGIPVNIDQEDGVNQLVRLGTAILIDPYKELTKKTLLLAIEKILKEKKYKQNTERVKKALSKYNGVKRAADLIEKFFFSSFRE